MPDVRAMCAIGLSGQLGLNGHLPWQGNREREFVADVERFWDLTRGHVIIMGPRTYASVPAFAFAKREIVTIRRNEAPADVLARFAGRVVFIGGGPDVYASYAPYVRHWDINRLPYDGDADCWFDPQWLLTGTRHP